MPWDPKIYEKFKNVRYQPFYDLMAMIKSDHHQHAIDLGCGTGKQTAILSERFGKTYFTGVDSSVEMLEHSNRLAHERLHFIHATTEDILRTGEQWDLLFSNAALQWSDHHRTLFPLLLQRLNTGGEFAVQMPFQPENILNRLLFELVQQEPFYSQLKGWKRESPLLSIDEYTQLLFDGGLEDLSIIQKVYPIIAPDHETLYNFIAGSALIPYMDRLDGEQRKKFAHTFKQRIAAHFTKLPAIYAFKRLLLYGRKP
jgi:trans-aconitate 2-methyltransferase